MLTKSLFLFTVMMSTAMASAPALATAPDASPDASPSRRPVVRTVTFRGTLFSRLGAWPYHAPYWLLLTERPDGYTYIDVSGVQAQAARLDTSHVTITGSFETRGLPGVGRRVSVLVATKLTRE